MDISQISPAILKEALRLLEEKQTLQAKLEKVNAELGAFLGGTAPAKAKAKPKKPATKPKTAKVKAPAPKTKSPAPKGSPLKDRVIPILKAAGSAGVAVPDLAKTLGVVPANLHVWFSTTGKKVSSIKKVGRGRYAWKKTAETPAPKSPAVEPASPSEQPLPASEPAVHQQSTFTEAALTPDTPAEQSENNGQ